MERYPASVGSGIFWCRSGCRPGGRGGSILKMGSHPQAVARSLSGGDFWSLAVRLWSISCRTRTKDYFRSSISYDPILNMKFATAPRLDGCGFHGRSRRDTQPTYPSNRRGAHWVESAASRVALPCRDPSAIEVASVYRLW